MNDKTAHTVQTAAFTQSNIKAAMIIFPVYVKPAIKMHLNISF
jgi:hypothetical protein